MTEPSEEAVEAAARAMEEEERRRSCRMPLRVFGRSVQDGFVASQMPMARLALKAAYTIDTPRIIEAERERVREVVEGLTRHGHVKPGNKTLTLEPHKHGYWLIASEVLAAFSEPKGEGEE